MRRRHECTAVIGPSATVLNTGQLELLRSFGFSRRNKREVWDAFLENPEGFERCALEARAEGKRNGNTGAGLLVTMIRRGDHLLEADPSSPRPTGWRFARAGDGTSGSYVRDPAGVDRLPPDYDFTTHPPRYDVPWDDERRTLDWENARTSE